MNHLPRIPRHEGYSDPSVVVWCRKLQAQETRHAERLYREEADKFAASTGETITDWHADCAFTLGEQAYQVVSNNECLDVIKRRMVTSKAEGVAA